MTPAATPAPPGIDLTRTALGIEFGSTRIKAVLTDPSGAVLASGGHTWENSLIDGVWTYSIDEVETGLRAAYAALAKDLRAAHGVELTTTGAIGVSGMMHGYLPLDADGAPLTAFRTWRNTITAESSAALSALFGLNIPQRWSVSHLHRAVTGGEEHVASIARITTLAGYVHWRLTGQHVLGVGEASGVFPIGADGRSFDADMIAAFDGAVAAPWSLADILPAVAVAGREAGRLTESGAALLDPTGALRPGIPLCPPEGDAGTGMVATDSVRPRTGNVSASTSAFAMIVLEAPAAQPHRGDRPGGHPIGSTGGHGPRQQLHLRPQRLGGGLLPVRRRPQPRRPQRSQQARRCGGAQEPSGVPTSPVEADTTRAGRSGSPRAAQSWLTMCSSGPMWRGRTRPPMSSDSSP